MTTNYVGLPARRAVIKRATAALNAWETTGNPDDLMRAIDALAEAAAILEGDGSAPSGARPSGGK